MTEVILSVARSLQGHDLKRRRTHIILLSPATHVLHDVSKSFPDLFIHRINAAVLPYRRRPELQDNVCNSDCCKNVFISNWNVYQSVSGRLKRIIKYARSERPIDELTDLSIDLRTRDGCDLVADDGKKDIPRLYLGHVHLYFARIRITKAHTQGVDLASLNPVFNSSLDCKNLRQDLSNAVALGAVKAHLFDVQLFCRSSLDTPDSWKYKETPFLIISKLGRLAPPWDSAIEVFQRLQFYRCNQATTAEAKTGLQNVLMRLNSTDEQIRKLVERMMRELDCHQEIQAYEDSYRQKLPLCPGPVELEGSAHEWLEDSWNGKKSKRKGLTQAEGEGISGLIQDVGGLEHSD